MHRIPLTDIERAGLEAHGLDIGTPSQLSDAFRQGIAWALSQSSAEPSAPVEIDERAQNAERYLFLRNREAQAWPGKERCLSVSVEDWSRNLGPEPEGIAHCNAWSSMDLFGEELDAEIDKARAALESKP